MEPFEVKVVGTRKPGDSPEECLRRAHELIAQADLLNPYPKPRGFVKKFKTYEDYARWRAEQTNPRLW